MNDKEIREAVNQAQSMLLSEDYVFSEKDEDAILLITKFATLYLNASEEFPKEKFIPDKFNNELETIEKVRREGFNLARSQCLAVHVKVVDNLRQRILTLQENNKNDMQEIKQLQSENEKLKEENASLHAQLKDYVNATFKHGEETAKLHQQIEGLRGALEKIVSLECTPYDCKCCPSEDIAKSALEEK